MTPPIDILDVAADHVARAQEWWRCTQIMQNSRATQKASIQARVALLLAEQDLARVERLVRELG